MSRTLGRYKAPKEDDGHPDVDLRPTKLGRARRGYEHFADEVGDDDQEDVFGSAISRIRVDFAHDPRVDVSGPSGAAAFDITDLGRGETPTADGESSTAGSAEALTGNGQDSPIDRLGSNNEAGGLPKQTLRSAVVVLTLNAALGGFLFGYDTGVVSGAMLQIKTPSQGLGALTSTEQEIIVSSTVAAAVVGSLVSGALQKNLVFGRKAMIIIGSVLFTIGALAMAVSWSVLSLTAGRSVVGIAVGIVSHAVPLYISECVPARFRGSLNTVNNVFIVFGQVIASLICCAFARAHVKQGWRWMLGLGGVPSLLMILGFAFLPESPRYILQKGGGSEKALQEAEQVLTRLRGRRDRESVEAELREAQSDVEACQRASLSLIGLLSPRHIRRALALGVFLQLLQQLVGVNTLMYYSATILQMSFSSGDELCAGEVADEVPFTKHTNVTVAAIETDVDAGVTEICLTSLVALAQLVGTFAGMCLVDRCGRRPLLLVSLSGVTVSLFLLGLAFHPMGVKMQGAPLAAMVLYLVFFGAGLAPLPWILNSEIYPLEAKSVCIGFATAANWIANFVVAATFMDLAEALSTDAVCPLAHPDGAFWLYTLVAAIGLAILIFKMPETKGLCLDEIVALFA